MGAFLAVIGIGWLIYQGIKSACEPTQTGTFNWDRYNQATSGKGYSSKQIAKMLESGQFHDKK